MDRPTPRFIGIDPGITGAIVLIDPVINYIIEWHKVPSVKVSVNRKLRKIIVPEELRELMVSLKRHKPTCAIESVHASPQMGVTSAFGFGYTNGVIDACASATFGDDNIIRVLPQKWKHHFGLVKCEKKQSIVVANSIFKKSKLTNVDVAEAALIAKYASECN